MFHRIWTGRSGRKICIVAWVFSGRAMMLEEDGYKDSFRVLKLVYNNISCMIKIMRMDCRKKYIGFVYRLSIDHLYTITVWGIFWPNSCKTDYVSVQILSKHQVTLDQRLNIGTKTHVDQGAAGPDRFHLLQAETSATNEHQCKPVVLVCRW